MTVQTTPQAAATPLRAAATDAPAPSTGASPRVRAALGGDGAGSRPNVLGLDLSITATGVADVDGTTSTIMTVPSDRDRRLAVIAAEVEFAVGAHRPDLVVIEDLPTHAHAAGITGMVHGAVRVALIRAGGVPYALAAPATLKKYATGRGNATKPDLRMALFQRTGLDLRDDNQVDAWWLRAMGLDHLGHPPVVVPKAQREALDKIAWPEVRA